GLGLALLPQRQKCVEKRENDQQKRRAPLFDDDTDDRSAQQHDLHRIAILVQESDQPWLLLRLREGVRAVFLQPALGFRLAESTGGGDILLLQGILDAEDVPCRLLARWVSEWWRCSGHALLLLETRRKQSGTRDR